MLQWDPDPTATIYSHNQAQLEPARSESQRERGGGAKEKRAKSGD